MKKLTIILGILILATTAFFLFKPQPIGTGTRTKMVYLDRENTFTATTTLEKGFVSTSTPTQAGQIVGLDENGKLPAVDGSQLTNTIKPIFIRFTASDNSKLESLTEVNPNAGGTYNSSGIAKSATIYGTGNIRVSYTAKGTGGGSINTYTRVHINGVAVGVEYMSNTSGVYETRTQDFAVKDNDLIQIFVRNTGGSYYTTGYIKDFKLLFDITANQIPGSI